MAELATIARPYADALFKASQSDVHAASAWIEALAAVTSHAQILELAHNPSSSTEQVFGVIQGVLKSMQPSADLPVAVQNFLHAVIENGRLDALPEMAAQFRAHVNTQSGVSDAVVYSAFDIDASALKEVTTVLEKRFERKLKVVVKLQPELIGGIRVVVGDEVLDTSVKARLEQMKVVLAA